MTTVILFVIFATLGLIIDHLINTSQGKTMSDAEHNREIKEITRQAKQMESWYR